METSASIELNIWIQCPKCKSAFNADHYTETKKIATKVMEIGVGNKIEQGISFICPECDQGSTITSIEEGSLV